MLFATFQHYPLGMLMSIVAIVLVLVFFITSADSATYVLAMQSEDGSINPHNSVKVIWGLILSAIAAVLLVAGGLDALQNVLIIVALPFSVLLLLMTIALVKELHYEAKQMGLEIKPETYPTKGEPFRSYEDEDAEVEDIVVDGDIALEGTDPVLQITSGKEFVPDAVK